MTPKEYPDSNLAPETGQGGTTSNPPATAPAPGAPPIKPLDGSGQGGTTGNPPKP